LLDRDGRTVAEINGSFVKHFASADGNTVAALEMAANVKEQAGERTLALRWFNRAGPERGRYQFLQHEDEPLPQIIFNANGSHILLVHPATGRAIFLDDNGGILRETALWADAAYANERPLFLAAGTEAFIVLSQHSPSASAGTVAPMIFSFSISGTEQWRRELPVGTAGGLAISDDGGWIAASRYSVNGALVESTISIFNHRGEVQAQIDGLFRRAIFAKDGSRLLLMDRRQLRAVSIPNGKLLWKINLPQRSEMFVDIAANAEQNKIFALIGASVFREKRFVFENARIGGFDNRGKKQADAPIAKPLIAPALVLSTDGQRLALGAEGLLQNFTIVDLMK
jgi:hypothetical protein